MAGAVRGVGVAGAGAAVMDTVGVMEAGVTATDTWVREVLRDTDTQAATDLAVERLQEVGSPEDMGPLEVADSMVAAVVDSTAAEVVTGNHG
jgi:hypothetical protein